MKNLLGFSYFPWMPKNNNNVNGVVLNRATFDRKKIMPTYNLCKTLTHELGHWFGLLHTFTNPNLIPVSNDKYAIGNAVINYDLKSNQDTIGDCVVDTFPQNNPTFGNPINNSRNFGRLITNDGGKQYMANFTNFMDYTDDAGMFCFTDDQTHKMRLFLTGFRPNIISKPINKNFNYKKNNIKPILKTVILLKKQHIADVALSVHVPVNVPVNRTIISVNQKLKLLNNDRKIIDNINNKKKLK